MLLNFDPNLKIPVLTGEKLYKIEGKYHNNNKEKQQQQQQQRGKATATTTATTKSNSNNNEEKQQRCTELLAMIRSFKMGSMYTGENDQCSKFLGCMWRYDMPYSHVEVIGKNPNRAVCRVPVGARNTAIFAFE